MAETDILNPPDWNQAPGSFNPNPSYGFTRKPANNRQLQRPRLGTFISRDTMNGGHIFSLSWVNTTLQIAQRVTGFYHDFKHGYFTLIDVDANNRQYVGRFTNEPNPQHTANGKYTVEGVVFEEVPTARMLQYPSDFTNDGHTLNVVDDYLKPRVALMQGLWLVEVSPLAGAGASASSPSSLEAFNQTPALGDWAQTHYVGWGFQMTFRLDASLGLVNVSLDGELVIIVDLSQGTTVNVSALASSQLNPPALPSLPSTVQIALTNVPLDVHRVKVAAAGAGVSGGTSVLFPAVRYIY